MERAGVRSLEGAGAVKEYACLLSLFQLLGKVGQLIPLILRYGNFFGLSQVVFVGNGYLLLIYKRAYAV